MARTITLKFPGTCADCGTKLAAGELARWYGRGRVYGIGCHPKPGEADDEDCKGGVLGHATEYRKALICIQPVRLARGPWP